MNKNVTVGVSILVILTIVFIYISQRQPAQADIDSLFMPVDVKVFSPEKVVKNYIDLESEIEDVDNETKNIEEKLSNDSESTKIEDVEKDLNIDDIEKDLEDIGDINLDF